MKKLIGLISIVFLASSCYMEHGYSSYGKISRDCPVFNSNAFFYKMGTGKTYSRKEVLRTGKQKNY